MWIEDEIERIGNQIHKFQADGLSVITSSSFQSHSIPLIHLISQVDNTIPVYFLNTGFHFAETIQYKNDIRKLLNINIIDLFSATEKVFQKDAMGRFFYAGEPNYCCYINKILPMEEVLKKHDIWVAGVRRDQTKNRQQMAEIEEAPHGARRFHPILDWTSKMIFEYQQKFNLPMHPLEEDGYLSVGCEPCTSKYLSSERDGRWEGLRKEECGLHTDLINKK